MHTRRSRRWLALPLAGVLALAACGDDDDASDATGAPAGTEAAVTTAATGADATTVDTAADTTTADTSEDITEDSDADSPTPADGGAVDLSADCPATVIIQTDWYPEAEHGWIYEMVGDGYTIDKDAVSVTGPLVAGGAETGVDIEIRTGGPAIGNQTVTSQMYTDDDILLGYVYTDEGIQNAGEFPTMAVMAGMEKNPQMIMWDPATYPDVETIADLGKTDAIVRYFGGAAYMEYFTQEGILPVDNTDGSYDGTPANFIAAQGKDAQQGFGSAEPYKYEFEFTDWGKPVAYQYINDAGWENYGESIAIKADKLEPNRACLEKLVPIIQQSSVDYLADPAETNEVILAAVTEFDSFWTYSPEIAEYAVQTMIDDGLLSNGPDGTIGNFDMDRVNGLIEKAIPVYTALGQAPPDGLTAEDVVTNEFIDDTIGL
jgi:hypothetical protein